MVRKTRRVTAAAAALGAAVSYHLPPRVSSAAPVDAAGTDGGHGTRDRRRLCGGLGWHASQPVNDGCSDDANYQESWTRPGLIDNFFHDTVEECCAFFFQGGACKRYPPTCTAEEPETERPTAAATARPAPAGGGNGPTGPCGAHGFHPDMSVENGCTNDDDYDPRWLDMDDVFHETGGGCCEHFGSIMGWQGCAVRDVCGSPAATDPPTAAATARPTARPTEAPVARPTRPPQAPVSFFFSAFSSNRSWLNVALTGFTPLLRNLRSVPAAARPASNACGTRTS